MLPTYVYLMFAFALVFIGLYCLSAKRNMIRMLFGVEILLNAANLCFIAFSSRWPPYVDALGHAVVIMSIIIGGCVIAVGLSMILNAYRHYKTLDVKELRRLRW